MNLKKERESMREKNEFQCLMSMPNLGDYLGQWIAIVGEQVIASGTDGKAVFKEAKRKCPNKEPLILKVPHDRVMLL
jgi:ferredoxin